MNTDFILALFQHGYKARISTLYHLLRGKRSSSVLLYGFLYNNLRFIEFFPDLNEKEYSEMIQALSHQELLKIIHANEAQITEKGMSKLREKGIPLERYPWIDNYHFGKKDFEMFRVLQFSVQVVSNLSYENKQYVPIESSPIYQWALKKWLTTLPKKELIHQLKEEWMMVLESLPDEEAVYFVQQFSGYQQVGKTVHQLLKTSDSCLEKQLLNKNYLHHLLVTIKQNHRLPLLQSMMNWSFFQNDNQSVQETKRYLDMTTNLELIAKKRKLKVSTIKDHLIELSLVDDFPFDLFIDEKIKKLLNEIKQRPLQEWSYPTVKSQIPTLDYFEFRLYQVQNIRKEGFK
ncbi:helix-turn-helix domain-containing protein [Enterococcus rivorum]|uniref:Helicase Helix-turn-helix domain-containing protein n=1 Tax=Enterococcus rivorum TaxID=762845 RepID=A0A1E5KXX6_9ENTE|nr:helix-turn-helix domain-containing protein [Enterococcus rivorum]MBP2099671.1 uncharacterized protein YpbB [Enterococcus rivorum]OEH82697.1 hypothetical protein BCR26_12235 [Enterococcus rivorum]